jgi:hypothetical protein
MDSVGDLVSREYASERDGLALRVGGGSEYDYGRFAATARKTGNLLRHRGVREGATVAVTDDAAPQAVLALFGAALLGASVRVVEPPVTVDARAVVAPTPDLDAFDLPAGGQRVGYGAEPADPSAAYFERDAWSENPAFPATTVPADAPLLHAGDRTLSHAGVLDAAEQVADGLSAADEVAVRARLAEPGAVVAGVVAPALAGATILLGDAVGSVAVTDGRDAPEPTTHRVETVISRR